MATASSCAKLLGVVIFALLALLVSAPKGLRETFVEMERPRASWGRLLHESDHGSPAFSTAAAAAAATAIAAGALIVGRAGSPGSWHTASASTDSAATGRSKGGRKPNSPIRDEVCPQGASDNRGASDDEEDYDGDGDAEDLKRSSSGKLWGKDQFPEGTKGHANFDLANIMAAQVTCACPCVRVRVHVTCACQCVCVCAHTWGHSPLASGAFMSAVACAGMDLSMPRPELHRS